MYDPEIKHHDELVSAALREFVRTDMVGPAGRKLMETYNGPSGIPPDRHLMWRTSESFAEKLIRRDLTSATSALIGTQKARPVPVIPAPRAQNFIAKLNVQTMTFMEEGVPISPTELSTQVAYAVTENVASTEGAPTYGQIVLRPNQISTTLKVGRKLLLMEGVELGLTDYILTPAIQAKLVDQVLNGTGTNSMTGILNTTNVGTTSLATADRTKQATLIDLTTTNGGVVHDDLAVVAPPATIQTLRARSLESGSAHFMVHNGKFDGLQVVECTAMPASTILVGAFSSKLLVVLFGGITFIVDPYTLGGAGTVRLSMHLFADVLVATPQAFAQGTSVS